MLDTHLVTSHANEPVADVAVGHRPVGHIPIAHHAAVGYANSNARHRVRKLLYCFSFCRYDIIDMTKTLVIKKNLGA